MPSGLATLLYQYHQCSAAVETARVGTARGGVIPQAAELPEGGESKLRVANCFFQELC